MSLLRNEAVRETGMQHAKSRRTASTAFSLIKGSTQRQTDVLTLYTETLPLKSLQRVVGSPQWTLIRFFPLRTNISRRRARQLGTNGAQRETGQGQRQGQREGQREGQRKGKGAVGMSWRVASAAALPVSAGMKL